MRLHFSCFGIIPWGLIDPNGSCPWTGPWTGLHGAHLHCRFPRIDADTVVVASLFIPDFALDRSAISEHSKPALRMRALSIRDGLEAEIRRDGSAALKGIGQNALDVSGFWLSFYHAIGSEIDPAPLIEALKIQGAQPALPVLLDRETMVFRAWDHNAKLVSVGFGTLGPDADQPEIMPDLILAPLAAFSSTGQRIGYGKGHYDRALSKMHASGHVPALVGLAFDEQECQPFPIEDHDIPLDGVLTPSGMRIFEHGRDALAPFLS